MELVDEDEFEVNQVKLGYSQELIERALVETERLADLLHRREEPFFEVAASWLGVVRARMGF